MPFSAGGPTDTVTRMIAEPMAKELGGKIVVQNVEGAGGTVGAGEVARAEPDGYTVLMHHIGMSTAPALYKDLGYKPLEDFEMVGLVTEVPMTVVARKDFAPATFQDLVTYVKANAGKVTLANAGIGAASHLCGLLFQSAAGVKLQEVPYQGTGPALTDLVGGQVDFMCDQTTNTSGQITAGKVKAYAVTTPERVKSLPDLPTTAEAGMPQLQVSVWHGLYVPAGTPQEVVQKLSDALKVALADQGGHRPDGQARHRAGPGGGRDPAGAPGPPRRAARHLGEDHRRRRGQGLLRWNVDGPSRTSSPGESSS